MDDITGLFLAKQSVLSYIGGLDQKDDCDGDSSEDTA